MKRKIFNAVDLLLLVIAFIITYFQKINVNGLNRRFLLFMKDSDFFVFLFIVVYFIALSLSFVLSCLAKQGHRDSKLQCICSILLLLSVFYEIIVMSNTEGQEVIWGSFPAIPLLVLLAIIVVLTFIKRSVTISDVQKVDVVEKTEIINQSSNADELKKYKGLLDNGTITQEEFDAKKKELLGL